MRIVPDLAPSDDFACQCDELGRKITELMYGYSKEVAICTLPGVLVAVSKTLGVSRDTIVKMLDVMLEDIGD